MSEKDLERYAEIILDLEAQLRQAQIVIGEKESRIKEAEDLSWKNWRDREEGYAEMRVTRQERDQAMAQLRQEREANVSLRANVGNLQRHLAAASDQIAQLLANITPQPKEEA